MSSYLQPVKQGLKKSWTYFLFPSICITSNDSHNAYSSLSIRLRLQVKALTKKKSKHLILQTKYFTKFNDYIIYPTFGSNCAYCR